ncbi:MAG: hypothetical protein NZ529_11060 [Cytophagaceae bacterium]|nr:hypothetical protein [Cytophagaceae bacterium]MDW8457323.1 hypothetical protein [Cytophagaceae bacterium]
MQGVQLIHLWEDIWIRKQPLVEQRISALCGAAVTVHARATQVKKISGKQAEFFFEQNHLASHAGAKEYFALIVNNEIMAAASFSRRTIIDRNGVSYHSYELIRFCNKAGYLVVGGLSKLLNYFAKNNFPDDIMTYADREWSDGASLEKTGFILSGVTTPLKFWVHKDTYLRIPYHKAPSHDEEMKKKGYVLISNCGNLKYIKYYKFM